LPSNPSTWMTSPIARSFTARISLIVLSRYRPVRQPEPPTAQAAPRGGGACGPGPCGPSAFSSMLLLAA
jgi:hypothetical protein